MTPFAPLLSALALAAAPAPAAATPDPVAVARRIDARINAKLAAAGVTPAPPADDATFLRRVHLLLVGRIPLPSDVHAFLADTDPNKRAKLVDRLLASAGHANHLTAVWRGWLVPEAATNPGLMYTAVVFDNWVRTRVRDNLPYNQFVTDLLTVDLNPPRRSAPRAADDDDRYTPDGSGSPVPFFLAKEAKPENLAAATARVFMGVQLECAQCHDHPFAKWTRDQFWELAAFYGGVEIGTRGNSLFNIREVFDRRELPIPSTDRVVQPTFLDETEPDLKPKVSSRVTLAAWLTRADNPFFARAMANRMWGFAFGVGIVDPVDDSHPSNPPSHPELLDELSKSFADSGFDVRFLLRAILLSDTFGRASAGAGGPLPSDADRLFARYPVRPLSPDQLYSSLQRVIGNGPDNRDFVVYDLDSPKRRFADTFAAGGKGETTIIQALTLMNGRLVGSAADESMSRPVAVAAQLPGLTDGERVDTLYLTALGRTPTAAERERALKHLKGGDPKKEYGQSKEYGDILWALLNGIEFRTNH